MSIQMEFSTQNGTELEQKLSLMSKRLDEMHESLHKQRKKLFAEMCYLKKICGSLEIENKELKKEIQEVKGEKIEWVYGTGDSLFDVREHKEASG